MSTFVNDLRLEEIGSGERSGTWGTATNTNLSLIAEAFSYGTETMGDANTTITMSDAVSDEVRSLYLKITSSADLTTTRVVTLAPNAVSKVWIIENATSGSQIITIKQGSGATVNIPNGSVKVIATDGGGTSGAVFDLFTDLDVAGTFAVAGNTTVGGTLTSTGAVTANAGVSIDNITIDGTEIDLSSGDLTLDVAGDIVLNSDDGIIFLKDDTATFGSLNNSSGNLIIKSGTTTAATFSGANVTLAGTVVTGGLTTLGGNLIIPNDGNIGSVGDTDAIDIDSNGVVTMNQIPVFSAGINVSGGTIIGTLATAAQTNITSVGALGGGSISSGFGAIDNGSSNITTTGTISFGSLTDGTTTITSVDQDISSVSSSHDTLATAKAIKAYVDSQTVTATGLSGIGTENVHIGGSSLANITSDAVRNVAFGQEAGTAITSGDLNVAVGYQALQSATTDSQHVAVGLGALGNTNQATSGDGHNGNVGVGTYAGATNITGRQQVFVGTRSGRYILGGQNTSCGHGALEGVFNTDTSDVQQCAAVGFNALSAITTGDSNTAVGASAGSKITTGHYNVLVGQEAHGPTTGDNNVAVGRGALSTNLTSGDDNVAIGFEAMRYVSGAQNVAVGYRALLGSSSTAMSGSSNVCIGYNAGGGQTGNISDNVYIGGNSGANATNEYNVAIGFRTLQNATGEKNTVIGWQAGNDITSGSNLTCVGYNADPSSNSATNQITLGDANVATLRCNTQTISSLSDIRDKKDVKDIDIGLDFVNDLRPVNFTWDRRDGSMNNIKSQGFIAQEVDQIQQKHDCEDYLQAVMKENLDKLEMSYGKFVPVLVSAIQDLSKQNKQLENRILELEKNNV